MAQQKPLSQKKPQTLDSLRKGDATTTSGIPPKLQTPLAVVSIFLVLLIFFAGVLSKDKAFNAGDNIASQSILPYLQAAQAAGTAVPQWIPNIFCGMPSFASLVSTGARTYDIVHQVFDLVRDIPVGIFGGNDAMIHIWHYFIFGLGMYLLLRLGRKTAHLVAFFAAFAGMFSTWIITYAMIGHNTKVFAVMCFPYILLALEKLREEKITWQRMVFWCSALAIALHFLLESSHPQMAFYQFLAILIYFIVWLITDLREYKDGWKQIIFVIVPIVYYLIFSPSIIQFAYILGGVTLLNFIVWVILTNNQKASILPSHKTAIISMLMVALAFGMSADRYMSSLGYDPYSIRGASPLVDRSTLTAGAPQKATSSTGVSTSGGLDWNYATEYSFSPGEMITFLVPGYYGFGKQSYSGPEVASETKIETYWGQATMTDCANYTGTIVFFLALIGIFSLWKRERLVAPLAIISLFALLLSFGSTMPLVFKPMFNYFPVFNKFRAPMMALVLMQMCFPILAALTLQQIIDVVKNNNDKALKARLTKYTTYAMYAAGGLFVIFLLGRGIFDGAIRTGIKASGKPIAGYPASIQDLAVSTGLNDAAICLLLATIAIGSLWMYIRGKLKNAAIPVAVVVVLTVIDLWRVDYRPLDITSKNDYDAAFNEHDYISFIKQDKSLYRVMDMNEPTSNIPVSWGLQTIAGYHAAKMRTYQDVVDVTGDAQGYYIFNPAMWSLLNTKYIIANGAVDSIQGRLSPVFISKEQTQSREGKKEQTVVWKNNAVLPRAFFVRSYEVHPPLEYLNIMREGMYNPRDVMFFDKQPEGMLPTVDSALGSNETVEITKYENEHVEMKTTTNYARLLFMSDSWYPDWEATIDGKPTIIYKADWAFRAFAVPAGTHTLTLTYHDNKYNTGRMISLITNVIAVLGLVLGIGTTMKWKKPNAAI